MKLITDLGTLYPSLWDTYRKRRYGIYACPKCQIHFKVRTDHVKNGNTTKCRSCANTQMRKKHETKT